MTLTTLVLCGVVLSSNGEGASTAGGDGLCACTEATGSYRVARTTPGCGDSCCCITVCEFDLFCCDVQWDERCVEEATALCDQCTFCSADLTGDLAVDGADLSQLLGEWDRSGDHLPADLDGDGRVTAADLGFMLGQWGDCLPGCA